MIIIVSKFKIKFNNINFIYVNTFQVEIKIHSMLICDYFYIINIPKYKSILQISLDFLSYVLN